MHFYTAALQLDDIRQQEAFSGWLWLQSDGVSDSTLFCPSVKEAYHTDWKRQKTIQTVILKKKTETSQRKPGSGCEHKRKKKWISEADSNRTNEMYVSQSQNTLWSIYQSSIHIMQKRKIPPW